MNHDLKSLSVWLKANKLCLNAKKTELIIFSSRKKKLDYTLKFKLNEKRQRPNHAIKYLGVLQEKHLQWIKQTIRIKMKLNCATGILSKMRNYTNRDILKMIYYSLFGSHLQYGAHLWEQANTENQKQIQLLQNKAVKKNMFQKAI